MPRYAPFEAAQLERRLWTPDALRGNGLSFWMDARGPHVTIATGVSSWTDNFGARSWSQGTGANQPAHGRTSFNGRPGLTFDGSNDKLRMDLSASPVSQPLTLVLVARYTSLVADAHLSDGEGTSNRILIGATNPATQWQMYAGSSALSGGTLDTSPHVIIGEFNGASSRLLIDGTVAISGNPGTQAFSDQRIGASVLDFAFAPAVFGAVALLSGVSQRTTDLLGGWAAHAFGLAANLPASHPYKSLPPLIGK